MTNPITPPTYLAIMSHDPKFMFKLIDWLNAQKVDSNSTVVRVHDMDPYEELDLRIAQIEGMTERIQDLEKRNEEYYREHLQSCITTARAAAASMD